jgi:hypothetical protein
MEQMSENRPPRRPDYGRDHAPVRTPDDRERRAQARRAAEALFTPKPPMTKKPAASVVPVQVRPTPIKAPTQPEPSAKAISALHLPRIRTWLKYGMTIGQVAAVYGVDAGEITKLLGKS